MFLRFFRTIVFFHCVGGQSDDFFVSSVHIGKIMIITFMRKFGYMVKYAEVKVVLLEKSGKNNKYVA